MRREKNSLFIPLFMALSNSQNNAEQQLAELAHFMQTTQMAVKTLREGMETFQVGFHKLNQRPAPIKNNPSPIPKPEPTQCIPPEATAEPDDDVLYENEEPKRTLC